METEDKCWKGGEDRRVPFPTSRMAARSDSLLLPFSSGEATNPRSTDQGRSLVGVWPRDKASHWTAKQPAAEIVDNSVTSTNAHGCPGMGVASLWSISPTAEQHRSMLPAALMKPPATCFATPAWDLQHRQWSSAGKHPWLSWQWSRQPCRPAARGLHQRWQLWARLLIVAQLMPRLFRSRPVHMPADEPLSGRPSAAPTAEWFLGPCTQPAIHPMANHWRELQLTF